MKRIHSFSSFNSLYETNDVTGGETGKSLGIDPSEKSKLYDQTLGMILTTILNSYASLVSYPESPYDSKIEPDLNSVKNSPLEEKVSEFGKIMNSVKKSAGDNRVPGAMKAIDSWIEVGTKASEALASVINQYKDQPEEQIYINDFINAYLDNYLKEIEDASDENLLRKEVSSMTRESQETLFEGLFQGKKRMIEDVSKKITLVMAKLGSMSNIPGMSSEINKLQSEVASIASQMADLLSKKNKDINKEDIKKADARLTEIPTVLDKKSGQMLKQDSTNKEAASILVQALDLVRKAKIAENEYIRNKEEAEKKELDRESSRTVAEFSVEKIKEVNPDVKKFQDLVISKLGQNKQISSLVSFKKMGSDGKYGLGTKQMVEIVKSGFGLQDTSGDVITGELMRELEAQESLKESRIFKFSQFSVFGLNEAFDVARAIETAKKVSPVFKGKPVKGKSGSKSSPKKMKTFKVEKKIYEIVYQILRGSLYIGTDERKILNAIEKIKTLEDLKAVNQIIKMTYEYRKIPGKDRFEKSAANLDGGITWPDLKDLKKEFDDSRILTLVNDEYPDLKSIINGEFESDDRSTVSSIVYHLRKIKGVKATFKKSSDGDFVEKSFDLIGI